MLTAALLSALAAPARDVHGTVAVVLRVVCTLLGAVGGWAAADELDERDRNPARERVRIGEHVRMPRVRYLAIPVLVLLPIMLATGAFLGGRDVQAWGAIGLGIGILQSVILWVIWSRGGAGPKARW